MHIHLSNIFAFYFITGGVTTIPRVLYLVNGGGVTEKENETSIRTVDVYRDIVNNKKGSLICTSFLSPYLSLTLAVLCRLRYFKPSESINTGVTAPSFPSPPSPPHPPHSGLKMQSTAMSTLPSAVQSSLPAKLNVFVPMASLRRAVDAGRAETDFTAQKTAQDTTGLHLDGVHTGCMLFGTGLHHAMTIEHASVAKEATALFSRTPSPQDATKTNTLAAMKRAVLRTAENSHADDLLHLHCTSHYWSLSAGCTTSVEGVVLASVPGGTVLATSLPLVLQAAEGAVLHPDTVLVEEEGLAVGASVWLALTWDGGDGVVVGGVAGVPALSAREELLSFCGSGAQVAVFANPVDMVTKSEAVGNAFRDCTTSAELCSNALSAAEAHVQTIRHCPLYMTSDGGRHVPFAQVSLGQGKIFFSGGADTVSVNLDGSDAQHVRTWGRLVAVCRRVGVHVSPYCEATVLKYGRHLPPADTSTKGTRRCSENELAHLSEGEYRLGEHRCKFVVDAWEVVDPAAEFDFNQLELKLAAKGKGANRVDRVSAWWDGVHDAESSDHLQLSMNDCNRDASHLIILYDVLLSQGVDSVRVGVERGRYMDEEWNIEYPLHQFPSDTSFVAAKKRCLPRYFLLITASGVRKECEVLHPFIPTPLPQERTPHQRQPDLRGNGQSLSDVLLLVPQENVLVSADPVTHPQLRYILTQRLGSLWKTNLCTELTMTPEWYDVYNAYRLSAASSGCVEKELWGLHPYVHEMGVGVQDTASEATFPGFDVPTLSWLLPRRTTRGGLGEGYYFTSIADKACSDMAQVAATYREKYGERAQDPLAPVCVLVRYRVAWRDAVQYESSFIHWANTYVVRTQAQFVPVGAVTIWLQDPNQEPKDLVPLRTGADTSKNPTRYYNQRAKFHC